MIAKVGQDDELYVPPHDGPLEKLLDYGKPFAEKQDERQVEATSATPVEEQRRTEYERLRGLMQTISAYTASGKSLTNAPPPAVSEHATLGEIQSALASAERSADEVRENEAKETQQQLTQGLLMASGAMGNPAMMAALMAASGVREQLMSMDGGEFFKGARDAGKAPMFDLASALQVSQNAPAAPQLSGQSFKIV